MFIILVFLIKKCVFWNIELSSYLECNVSFSQGRHTEGGGWEGYKEVIWIERTVSSNHPRLKLDFEQEMNPPPLYSPSDFIFLLSCLVILRHLWAHLSQKSIPILHKNFWTFSLCMIIVSLAKKLLFEYHLFVYTGMYRYVQVNNVKFNLTTIQHHITHIDYLHRTSLCSPCN